MMLIMNRPQTEQDKTALRLLAEGFRRIRAQSFNAGTGAPGEGDSFPLSHASTQPQERTKGTT